MSSSFAALFSLPGADAPPERPGERLHLFRPAHLPETDWFAAADSARMWRVYHEQYTFCVLPPEDNARDAGALYSYRSSDVRCRPAAAYFYEPDTVHANRTIYRAAAFYVVRVDTATVVELARELGLGERPHLRTAESPSPRLLRRFEALTASLSDPDPLLAETRLVELLRAVLREVGEVRPVEPACAQTAVARAREYLHARVLEPVTLDELARVAGLSRYHLVRSFRAVHGLAPHAYLSALRCARVRRLLLAGVPPVAIEAGFFDQSHLTRHFVRAFGMTPAAFQRALAIAVRPAAELTAGARMS
jgi:AraC-like DNA-binding protein